MNRLFVYGIFLSESQRARYGMTNPQYATVKNYVTYGDQIVTAYKQENAGLALTGLLVDVDPEHWDRIDRLEGGYVRTVITTTGGEQAYMYAGKEYDDTTAATV